MFSRIDTVFVYVSDLAQSVAWYTQNLGFEQRWIHGNVAALNVGETALTLMQEDGKTASSQVHFNFYTAEIAEAHAKLTSRSVPVTDIVDYGDVTVFYITDPDGNQLGVCSF